MTLTESRSLQQSRRTRPAIAAASVVAGLVLALLAPMPFLLLNLMFDGSIDGGIFGFYWADSVRWVAVAAFAAVLTVMLTRVGRPSGGYVGAVIAASVGAYIVVGAVAPLLIYGGSADDLLVLTIWSVASGAVLVAIAIAAGMCWWARRFS